jgi:hypothetical protein
MRVPVAAIVSALAFVSCDNDNRDYFDEEFEYPLYGTPRDEFRSFLVEALHMEALDADCFAVEADKNPPAANGYWSADQLNVFADRCGVDVSQLWYEVGAFET